MTSPSTVQDPTTGAFVLELARTELVAITALRYREKGPHNALTIETFEAAIVRKFNRAANADAGEPETWLITEAAEVALLQAKLCGRLHVTQIWKSWPTNSSAWPVLAKDPVTLISTWWSVPVRGRRPHEQRAAIISHVVDLSRMAVLCGDPVQAHAALVLALTAVTHASPATLPEQVAQLQAIPVHDAGALLRLLVDTFDQRVPTQQVPALISALIVAATD